MRLEMEKDLETVRQAALLLQAENQKLVALNVELQKKLLKLEGHSSEQLALRIAQLEQQLSNRNKQLFGKSSEKRNRRDKAAGPKAPQQGHGPKQQPDLPVVEEVVPLGAVGDTRCPHCDKPVAEWEGQFEDSEEIDVISRMFVKKTIRRQKARCECCRTIVTAPVPPKIFPGARYSIGFAVLVVVSKYIDHRAPRRRGREAVMAA